MKPGERGGAQFTGPDIHRILKTSQIRRLVDDVPDVDSSLEPGNDLPDASRRKALDLGRIVRQPSGRTGRMVPGQGMSLAGDAVGPAPIRHLVRVLIIRLARFWFVRAPVKAERGVVEQ